MADFRERAMAAYAEAVARGEHDAQCEYIANPYICHCSKRAREARGLTVPPELEWQYPICLGCGEEVDDDGDSLNCSRCCCTWNFKGGNGEFYDDYGDDAFKPAVVDVHLPAEEPSRG